MLSKGEVEIRIPVVLNSNNHNKEVPSIERVTVIKNHPGYSLTEECAKRNFAATAIKTSLTIEDFHLIMSSVPKWWNW